MTAQWLRALPWNREDLSLTYTSLRKTVSVISHATRSHSDLHRPRAETSCGILNPKLKDCRKVCHCKGMTQNWHSVELLRITEQH
ncbi:hypothetical protein EVAR_88088_1 [Eumeta japonica]|uniref:Uncharacterized protein n=1 Tax=Eumeta variegata TaxID=151549 RepID=A0A4C1WIA7_EUMVA|nr:hypothetical protein EVAR_88088_1 [Eumeta japonica]